MSYSRWIGSRWYTYWACQDDATENRDTAIFEICAGVSFTAAELRADIKTCVDLAVTEERTRSGSCVSDEERQELQGYMLEFLADVDAIYPEWLRRMGSKMTRFIRFVADTWTKLVTRTIGRKCETCGKRFRVGISPRVCSEDCFSNRTPF